VIALGGKWMKRKIGADGIEQILNVSNSSPRLIFYIFSPLTGKMSHLIEIIFDIFLSFAVIVLEI
jgi:hypothetical protein